MMRMSEAATHSDTRDRGIRRVIVIEGQANAAVVVTKLFVGVTTGSLAIIGDAVHSLTDVLNNVLAWLVMRVSSSPADDEHPYGHRKFESLAVFVLATLLVALAFELVVAAVTRETRAVDSTPLALGLMLSTLVVNVSLAWWQRGWARRLDADILHADASHTFSDALTTVAVIIGWQLSVYGLPWLDRVVAVIVAGVVLWLAYRLFRRAVPILVDESALDTAAVEELLRELGGVQGVNRVRSRRSGTRLALDLELAVDPGLTIAAGADIRRSAEQALTRRFGEVDAVIALVPSAERGAP